MWTLYGLNGMKELRYIESEVKKMLTPRRFEHSLGVRDTAVQLAVKYDANSDKAALAGLTHDCAKDLGYQEMMELVKKYNINLDEISRLEPSLIHGPLGACIAQDVFEIYDEEVLNEIRYHTTGRPSMTLLEKIIYLADYIEPHRDFPGVNKLRNVAKCDLDNAMILAFDNTITHVISLRGLLHPNTIFARNDLIVRLKPKE